MTAVELLPIDEFDENDCPFVNPLTGERLRNFWGYNTIAFARPRRPTPAIPERSGPWEEFRSNGPAFHDAGIEVILDVVFNHTAEGGEDGPDVQLPGPGQHASTTCSTSRVGTSTSPAAATPSTATTRWSATYLLDCLRNWVWTRRTSTGSGSTWPRSWGATAAAKSWSSRR